MQSYRKAAKSDGYIKNQNISMRKTRTVIFLKIALVVVPLVLFLIFYAGLILSTPSPEKWQQKDVTFSDISREYVMRSSPYFLNTTDEGSFILPLGTEEIEALTQQLKPNGQYQIIYTENIFFRITQSLSSDSGEFIMLDKSVAKWEKERKELCVFSVIIFILMVVGSILIYNFWCKKERQQIKKIKSKITDRMNKNKKKEQWF